MPDRFTLLETIDLLGTPGCAELASRLGEAEGTIRVALHRACRGGYIVSVEGGGYALTQRGANRLAWLRARESVTNDFDDAGDAEAADLQEDTSEVPAADGWESAADVEDAEMSDDAAKSDDSVKSEKAEGDEPIFRCACQEWTGDFEPGEVCQDCGQPFEWVDEV